MPKDFFIEHEKDSPFKVVEADLKDEKFPSWDRMFELHAYEVRVQTLSEFEKDIRIFVENRATINYVFSVAMMDVQVIANPDVIEVFFFQGLFTRALKTSKLIQDLCAEGNYVEAYNLLRTNFERILLLEFFCKNGSKLKTFLEARKTGDKKVLAEFTVRKLTGHVKRNYSVYKYLSAFVHPHTYDFDIVAGSVEKENYIQVTQFNGFDKKHFLWICAQNNNLLIDGMFCLAEYIKRLIPKEEKEAYDKLWEKLKLGYMVFGDAEKSKAKRDDLKS